MFCKHCWREIVDDSVFCSYCGKRVDTPEAAPSKKSQQAQQSAAAAPCIQPGQPRKRCRGCGKELPASMISDLCAMCTIRKRNLELETLRAKEDAQEKIDYARAHAQRLSQQAPAKVTVAAQDKGRGKKADDGEPRKRRFGCGCLLILLIAAVLLFLATDIGMQIYHGVQRSRIAESAVEVSIAASEPLPDDVPQGDLSPASPPQRLYWNENPCLESKQDFLDLRVMPMLEQTLLLDVPTLTTVDEAEILYQSVYSTGSFTYLPGTLVYTDWNDITHDTTFLLGWIASEQETMPVYLLLGGDVIYDARETLVTEEGALTDEGAEYYGGAPGEPLLSGEPVDFSALPDSVSA